MIWCTLNPKSKKKVLCNHTNNKLFNLQCITTCTLQKEELIINVKFYITNSVQSVNYVCVKPYRINKENILSDSTQELNMCYKQ